MIKTIKNCQKKIKLLSVFDFDGTLTYHDSFIHFLYFAFKKWFFIKRLVYMIIPTLLYISYIINRDKLKAILIKTFLTNVEEKWLSYQAEIFCKEYWSKLMRLNAVLAVKKELTSNAEVIICSASPTLILKPFANKLGAKLIGTELEVKHGKLTGHIVGHNCRCIQKVIKLELIYGNLKNYHLRAWGDTRGDYELLTIAQEPHWREFSNNLHKINKNYK